MSWNLVKQLHVAFALVTAASFAVRGYWVLSGSPHAAARMTRWLPHLVDSLLFVTGLAMAIALSISPFDQSWFAAKLVAIVVYVVLGHVTLKRGRSFRGKAFAYALSLLVLSYVFAVALSRDPWAGLSP